MFAVSTTPNVSKKRTMYGHFGTTLIQTGLLVAGIIMFGEITGRWLESAFVFVTGALIFSVWRRNQLYRWLEKRPGEPITQIPGMWLDMTRRIQLREAELLRERDQVQGLLANLHQSLGSLDAGLVHLSPNWKIDWWNEPATELLGLRVGFDKDASFFNLVRTPELTRYVEEENFELPITLPSPIQANKQLEYTVCAIHDTGFLLVVRDVTRFKRLERMRSDFIANVSHELKTPLTVIKGYMETILDNRLVTGSGQRAIEQAAKQAQRMHSLLQDLLTLSQLETTPPDPKPIQIDVSDLLIDAERHGEEVKTVLDRPGTVIQRGPVAPLSILGDWSELSSALTNLVANAIRYSPDGSVIELSVKTRGDQAVLVVKDNGPGIPAEHLPRLTERFYRVDNSHSPTTGGTGLGLAIVKHILYRHEGELEIQSVMGEGAEFRCVLPATRVNLQVQERTRA